MTQDEFDQLQPGCIVQSASGEGYIITQCGPYGFIAVRTISVTNPGEWTRIPPPPSKPRRPFAS